MDVQDLNMTAAGREGTCKKTENIEQDAEDGNLYDVYTTFNLEEERGHDTPHSTSIIFRSKEFLTLVILILIILTSVIALISEYKKFTGCRSDYSEFGGDLPDYNTSQPRSLH